MIKDTHGRVIRYLRLSVTGGCSMKCLYCKPRNGWQRVRMELSAPEIEDLVSCLVRFHGLQKVRLTGGEPTVRDDLLEIISRLSRIKGLDDISLTTNGLTLASQAEKLKAAGLMRVNVSLDTYETDRFRRITGVDGLSLVLDGIQAALACRLLPVKINTVVIRGENDHEMGNLLGFAAQLGVTIRFIELMPMGPLAEKWEEHFVSEAEIRSRLDEHVQEWRPVHAGRAAARLYQVRLNNGQTTTIGFISAMTCPFCLQCDRLRIAADGSVYPCLMGQSHGNVLSALRPCLDSSLLERRLHEACSVKAAGHPRVAPVVMTNIGG